MNRVLTMLMAGAFALSLGACNKAEDPAEVQADVAEAEAEATEEVAEAQTDMNQDTMEGQEETALACRSHDVLSSAEHRQQASIDDRGLAAA